MSTENLFKLTCDRCSHCETHSGGGNIGWGRLYFNQVNGPLGSGIKESDLCPACLKELQQWFKDTTT
jgi:hypothetical protein